MIEREGSSPRWSGGRIFFSRVKKKSRKKALGSPSCAKKSVFCFCFSSFIFLYELEEECENECIQRNMIGLTGVVVGCHQNNGGYLENNPFFD